MRVIQIPAGIRGFDCNSPVSFKDARKLMAAGYRFAVRYVPRIKAKAYDLSSEELKNILAAGLGLMAVQHVEAETGHGWTTTGVKGRQYGAVAAGHAEACGLPLGTNVWLDLEDVDLKMTHQSVIDYCNAWYDEVAKVGYTPGIYVGFHPVLTPLELYQRLKFEHYWGAYNLNRDQVPAVRGLQMKQGLEVAVTGVGYKIDPNVVMRDNKGGLPLVCAPDEWDIG